MPSVFLLNTAMNTATAPDTRAADEAVIRQLDIAWSRAAEMNDLEGIVNMYAEDAVVMVPHAAIVIGKQAARELNRAMLSTPGFLVQWRPDSVEVARFGDIGYVLGTYDLTVNDATGIPMTDKGKYVEIWKKQTDGSWKVAVEALNSDLPPRLVPPSSANE